MVTATEKNEEGAEEQLIYSAKQYEDEYENSNSATETIPQILDLNLRGVSVKVDRDTLVSLPESLLIAMFPNGLVLGRLNPNSIDNNNEEETEESNKGVMTTFVDFDYGCLDYVLKFYQYAQESREEHEIQNNQHDINFNYTTSTPYYPSLLDKRPIIVLREELEYYCVISKPIKDLVQIKLASGEYLKQENLIFAALQKNIARESNIAEQHLIDMLCDAGFTRQDTWGYREIEPNRTCIVSMSLILLKTTGSENHTATAQKLLLFWRKPARKCWWDGKTVDICNEPIKLWARRTWTLELALI